LRAYAARSVADRRPDVVSFSARTPATSAHIRCIKGERDAEDRHPGLVGAARPGLHTRVDPHPNRAAHAASSPLPATEDGIGDPYYPQLGNGGYDALHYMW